MLYFLFGKPFDIVLLDLLKSGPRAVIALATVHGSIMGVYMRHFASD